VVPKLEIRKLSEEDVAQRLSSSKSGSQVSRSQIPNISSASHYLFYTRGKSSNVTSGEVYFNQSDIFYPVMFSAFDHKGLHKPQCIPKFPVSNRFWRFRESDFWIYGNTPKLSWFHVPLVERDGSISSSCIAVWYTTPTRFIASLIATIFQKLVRCKFNHRKQIQLDSLLYRLASLYAVTQDHSMFCRVIECLKRKPKIAFSLLYRFEKKSVESTRFCLGQLQLCSLWLQLRRDRRELFFTRQRLRYGKPDADIILKRNAGRKQLSVLNRCFSESTAYFSVNKESAKFYGINSGKTGSCQAFCRTRLR
jgi:hypothetical protein